MVVFVKGRNEQYHPGVKLAAATAGGGLIGRQVGRWAVAKLSKDLHKMFGGFGAGRRSGYKMTKDTAQWMGKVGRKWGVAGATVGGGGYLIGRMFKQGARRRSAARR